MQAGNENLIEDHDAVGLAALIQSGQVEARDLLEAAIARAELVNPRINAICHFMKDAARGDANLKLPSGPLGGVPFLLKDITTHVAGWPMTSGSLTFRDYISNFDSNIVGRYRKAGLVMFGRTTTPEFGYGCSSESRLFGKTRNPWNLALSSGGSSGGAAAAVAAGIVPVAQGGDAGGSIRIPASYCGLFGLKPTRARTPAGPVHGTFLGFAGTHVISRSVRDSALLLDLTGGPDAGAPYHAEQPVQPYIEAVGAQPGRLRIALQRRAFNDVAVEPECLRAVDDAARLCETLGHDIVEVDFRFDHSRLQQTYYTVWPALLLRALNQYSEQTERAWRFDDLETFVAEQVRRALHFSAQDLLEGIENMHLVSRQFREHSEEFDIVLSPTTANVAPKLGVLDPSNPDRDALDQALQASVAFTQIYNLTGQPAASVPLYWTKDDVPVGVQIAARYGDETSLFKLAAQLEEARPWFGRRPQLASSG